MNRSGHNRGLSLFTDGAKRSRRIGTVPGAGIYLLSVVLCVVSLFSCAPKHVETPSFEGPGLKERMAELGEIKSIEAALEVAYEKDGGVMNGDGALSLSEDNLTLRMYYRGFMVGEVSENAGIVTSNPKLNKARSAILVDGLKSGFFWWNLRDYKVEEYEDVYILRNYIRKLTVDKKTLLPVRQTLELYDGDILDIYYDSPAKAEADEEEQNGQAAVLKLGDRPLWYQSGLRIEFRNNIIKLKIKSYSAYR